MTTPTLAEQLRAYVLLHEWQARNVEMNGACVFVPPTGAYRVRYSFSWHPEMSSDAIRSGLERIASHEERLIEQVREDLSTAFELMQESGQ